MIHKFAPLHGHILVFDFGRVHLLIDKTFMVTPHTFDGPFFVPQFARGAY